MVEVTKENFREVVADGVTLVDVWGPQCGPCIAMMPEVEKMAEQRADEFTVAKLEAPKNRRLCMELKLMGLPVFLLFRDGEEIARLDGADVNMAGLRQWLDETLGSKTAERG